LENSENKILKSRLERLEKILGFKNRKYCRKFLKNLINEFFGE